MPQTSDQYWSTCLFFNAGPRSLNCRDELTDGEPRHVLQRLVVVVVVLRVADVQLELRKVASRALEAATAVLALASAGANLDQDLGKLV